MKFDIVLCFVTATAGRVTGFLTAEPIAEDRAEVTRARDMLQAGISGLDTLTMYTRDTSPMLPGKAPSALEITLPGDVIKNSVMLSQIIEVAE